MAESFTKDFKRFFLRGLAAVLPTVLTLVIIVWVFTKIQQYAGRYINTAAIWLIEKIWTYFAAPQTQAARDSLNQDLVSFYGTWDMYFWWVGFIIAIIGIYIVGRFVASFLGRGMWRLIEQTFLRLPVVKQVYPYIKQVTDFLLSERRVEFSRVVAVEYPRKGVWSLGLVTGSGMRTLDHNLSGDLLTIFIPSSPTPFTGYTITVRRNEVIDVPINIDEALRFTVSGGVIMPLSQQPSDAKIDQARRGTLPPATNKEILE